jgi:hypothetical protein
VNGYKKTISEIMNFDKKNITYYSPQKDQRIVAPFNNTDIPQILHEANLRYSEEVTVHGFKHG